MNRFGEARMAKVAHVLTALDFGGVEGVMKLVAQNAGQARYFHQFCALQGGGAVAEELRALGAETTLLQANARIPSLAALIRLTRFLRRTRPDVVHLHGAEANFHGAVAGRLAKVPALIAEEIGLPGHSRKARLVFRWAYRRCDCVVAISQAVKAHIVALGETDANRVSVIYNPVGLLPKREWAVSDGVLRLGFVGRLESVKNPIAAIEAVGELRDRGRDVRLTIVGDGSQRSFLEQRIASQGLGQHVVLAGFHPQPFSLLGDCDLYLQPSLGEGFGLAICEAMSAGIPVIASAVGGAPEIIRHGETGWLLDKPTASALVRTIEEVLRQGEGRLAEVGNRASGGVAARFAPNVYLKHCESLYDRLLGRS